MAIGPNILGQAAESLRKIRNSARFILGNIGDEESRSGFERVGRNEMGLVSSLSHYETSIMGIDARFPARLNDT
jgi:isoleucyl-tRNA synthetase